jgi:hypothetical protein
MDCLTGIVHSIDSHSVVEKEIHWAIAQWIGTPRLKSYARVYNVPTQFLHPKVLVSYQAPTAYSRQKIQFLIGILL